MAKQLWSCVTMVVVLFLLSCTEKVRPERPKPLLKMYSLRNGLTVVLDPDATAPMVAVALDYRVGAADQPNGQAGFAHLFEHLLLQGTQHVSHVLQETIFEESGGFDNARTDYDYTELISVGPSTDLETILWIQADRMGFLLPNEGAAEGLARQKEVVTNERHERIDSAPSALALERLVGIIFPEPHPYHWLVIGPASLIESVALESAQHFYDLYYRPSNAVLVITGEFDADLASKLIEKYFGDLPKSDRKPAAPAPIPAQEAPAPNVRSEIFGAVPSTTILLGWATPPAFSNDEWAVRGAVGIIGDGESARLKQRLVTELKLATSADCTYRPLRLGSLVICEVEVADGIDPALVQEAAFSTIETVGKQGFSNAEFERALTVWRSRFVSEMEGVRKRALRLAWYSVSAGDPLFFRKDLETMMKLSPDQVQAAAARYLTRQKAAVVWLKPETQHESH